MPERAFSDIPSSVREIGSNEPDSQFVAAYHDKASEDNAKDDNSRRLILLFDGTGNKYGDKNSNVLHFLKCLKNDDENQLIYYQTGIATYADPALLTKMALDAAFGLDLQKHVQDGYRFLMQKYRPGDKISLFGFSRGAYTARVLFGFIQKVGLLQSENLEQIPFAWNVFRESDEEGGLKRCQEYKELFSRRVNVDFMGLWDTVASIGIEGKELPFAHPSGGGVRVYRHALALDERRAYFVPNFKLTLDGPHSLTEDDTKLKDLLLCREKQDAIQSMQKVDRGRVGLLDVCDDESSTKDAFLSAKAVLGKQTREVWFAGCHCDVGGGSEHNSARYSLARIPLRWMVRECFRMNTGIIFDRGMLREIGFAGLPFRMKEQPFEPRGDPNPPKSPRVTRPILRQIVGYLLFIPLFPLLVLVRILVHLSRLVIYSKCFQRKRLHDEESHTQLGLDRSDPQEGCEKHDQEVHGGLGMAGETKRKQVGKAHGDFDAQGSPNAEEKLEREDEDWSDAKQATHDELGCLWWIIELIPLLFRVQNSQGGRRGNFETRINLGRGRKIDGDAWNVCEGNRRYIEVHHSVGMRMKALPKYKPCARIENFNWDKGEPGWKHILWVR